MTHALHLGQLHAYEQWLVVAIAFGPFVVLAVVVYVVRGRRPVGDDPTLGAGSDRADED